MKKLFKMLSLICVLALSITAFSVLAMAAAGPSYNRGDILKASTLAEDFLELETDAERIAKAKELSDYLFANVIGVKYSKAVFAEIYGGVDCDNCRGKEDPCSNCEGKMGPYAEYRYNMYLKLVDKIMAYAAVYLIENFDSEAKIYQQRATVQWIERFLERDIADYTKSEVLAEDFFAEFAFELTSVKSVETDFENLKAVYTIVITNPAKDALDLAINETLDADMIAAIESVLVGETELTAEDYVYNDETGEFTIAEGKVTAPGVGYPLGEQAPAAGEIAITVVASIDEAYELPADDEAVADGEAADGEAADGEAADGEVADGEAADGEAADGEAADDEVVEVEEPTIKDYYEELKASVDATIEAAKDKLSSDSLDEYVYSTLHFNPDYTTGYTKYMLNYANATWYGTMYENGYRVGDVMPKFMYSFDGKKFSSVATGTGAYDKLDEGSYVIFDDSVSTFYQGSSTNFVEVPVKRNYVYNEVDGAFIQVEDGEGIYDFIQFGGYGQLLKPAPFLHIDKTNKYMASNNPLTNWSGTNTGGILNMVTQTDVTYFSSKGSMRFDMQYYRSSTGSNTGAVCLEMRNRDLIMNLAGRTPDGVARKAGEVKLIDAIVPGKWTNVAMVLRGADAEIDIYVDHELVYIARASYSDITGYYAVRASVHGDTTGDSIGGSLKNTRIFQGTAPRDFYKFDNMNSADEFVYYGDFISKEGPSAASKIYAYDQMALNLSLYFSLDTEHEGSHIDENGNVIGGAFESDNEAVNNAIKQFFSFDYETVSKEYKADNAKGYKALVDKLAAIQRRYSTIESRKTAVSDVDKFVAGYSDSDGNLIYIDTECDDYVTAKAAYDKACDLLANDEASFEFVYEMEQYNVTGLYKKKLMRYENATAILKTAVFDESITDEGETRLAAAYAIYEKAPEELEAMVYKQNSKYLVMYIEYTQDFDTVESWEANYNTLSYPLSKAREIINTGKYDPTYSEGEEGTDSYKSLENLLVWYELINSYFYDKIQAEHIAYIKQLQDRYAQSDSYMEKLGICSEIKRYMESADIDLENPELKLLVEKNEAYLAEIDALEAPYIAQRDKRTELFVSVIKKLTVAEGYNAIKALTEEASSYFYTMTVGATAVVTDEQITEAINKHNCYIEYVEKVAEFSADFVFVVEKLEDADTFAERYAVLAEANALLEYVSEDIDGVSEAYAEYEAAYEEYMAVIAPANAELKEAQSAVISLRSGYCVSAILAEFAKLIGSIVD